jgi:hypothetical protein
MAAALEDLRSARRRLLALIAYTDDFTEVAEMLDQLEQWRPRTVGRGPPSSTIGPTFTPGWPSSRSSTRWCQTSTSSRGRTRAGRVWARWPPGGGRGCPRRLPAWGGGGQLTSRALRASYGPGRWSRTPPKFVTPRQRVRWTRSSAGRRRSGSCGRAHGMQARVSRGRQPSGR